MLFSFFYPSNCGLTIIRLSIKLRELHSDIHHTKHYDFGMSFPNGNEEGDGKGVQISPSSLKRFRDDSHPKDHYAMISEL